MTVRSVTVLFALLVCSVCLAEEEPLSFFDHDSGVVGSSSTCKYNSTSHLCDGECSDGKDMCIQVSPGMCTCRVCEYDYGEDACVGAYCSGDELTWCLLVADKRCECSPCAWVGPEKEACFGACLNSLCYQAGPKSDCYCNEDRCTWDYASKRCVGSCSSHDPTGKTLCVQTGDEQCVCSGCEWDVAKKMCMGGIGGCGSDHGRGLSCNSIFEEGSCQCTEQDCLYDFSLKHCVNWGCDGNKDCVQWMEERCECKDPSGCYYNYDSGSCEGYCNYSYDKKCVPSSSDPTNCWCEST
ncbi:hypothetical protein KIPB_006802 [Kipferlia bialata]|uniref:Uncharacterized protein n=1 Tax=Kipferlia bialata TaxID=797122 RepID=A0A9K3CXT5_9EUKA|nr:hypothetical protein KIPB_006802 [Kipferlia bialata]|eukprot:g6802.t1